MANSEPLDRDQKGDRRNQEKGRFLDAIFNIRHEHVNPCFMTGKGCVYTDHIEETLNARAELFRSGVPSCAGFVIMPFRPALKVFFENCLIPFFLRNYGFDTTQSSSDVEGGKKRFILDTADQVSRPGIIICEGICKRIQESDFVVADISLANNNVFYELGLAYGIGHKIVVVFQQRAPFGNECYSKYFKAAGCNPYPYEDLGLIEADHFRVSEHIWRDLRRESLKPPSDPKILFLEMMMTGTPEKVQDAEISSEDITLLFSTHVKSHVGLAMSRIYEALKYRRVDAPRAIDAYLESIIAPHLREAEQLDPTKGFGEIKSTIDKAYCLIVRTGQNCHPMSYFWLGYAHARGKNVIPITVLEFDQDGKEKIVDLAFDIRAQRHMVFNPRRPDLLEHQLERTLREMVRSDFSEWSRKMFWERILGSKGEISIVTGALHSNDYKREMIGDWDLRAASELTSYFSRHRYHPKIETPIYQPEFAQKASGIGRAEYIQRVVEEIRLAEKNCVIIASPDVNPLAEIILGKLYGVPPVELFTGKLGTSFVAADAVVVWKQRKRSQANFTPTENGRVFYREEVGDSDDELRGFACRRIIDGKKLLKYLSQDEANATAQSFSVFAHLVIARNPFRDEKLPARYVIILNGVSGPATFALTHVLTGGGNQEFVSYDPAFDPAAKSEEILFKIAAPLHNEGFHALQCVIRVNVGHAPPVRSADGQQSSSGATFDWRRILSWDLETTVFGTELVTIEKNRVIAAAYA